MEYSQKHEQGKLLTYNFAALFFSTYLMFFATDFFIPVLPFFVLEAGGSSADVGLLMGLFTFSSVVLRPFQGQRLNKIGRKKLLVTGIAVYAAGGLGLVALPSWSTLFIFRILQGAGWGAFLLSFNTLAVDLAPSHRRGEAVGLMGVAPPLSLATAPLLGETLLSGSDNFTPVFLISLIVALLALGLSFTIREPVLEQTGDKPTTLFTRKVWLPSVMIFFITISFGGVITFLPMFGEARNLPYIGTFFTVFAVTAIIFRPLSGKLSDHLGRSRVFLPGLIIFGFSFIVIAMAYTRDTLLLGAILFGCGMSSTHPTLLALAADSLSGEERGTGMSTFTMAFDLGITFGAILLGLLLNRIDFEYIFIICAGSSFLSLSVFFTQRLIKLRAQKKMQGTDRY